MKTPSLVILISGAGYGNFGDDLILSKWITVYRDLDILLICGEHIEEHFNARIENRIILHLIDSKSEDIIRNIARNYKKVLIHIAGGGYCNDKFNTAPKVFSLLYNLQKSTTVIGTGLSFFPLSQNSSSILNKIRFSYLSFRDAYSKQAYEGRCSPLYGDDLLPVFSPASQSRHSKTLFINIQNQFDLVGKLSFVAKRVCEIAVAGKYSSVVLCELCTGDLDILDHLVINGLEIADRSSVLAGCLKPEIGDAYIGTRFHFRMLMENCGATGICIVADDYYANKHEETGPPCNFAPDRSALMSVDDFLQMPIYFPELSRKISLKLKLRIFGKRIESSLIRMLIRLGIVP